MKAPSRNCRFCFTETSMKRCAAVEDASLSASVPATVYIIDNLNQGSATNSSSAPAASLGGTAIDPDGVREKLTPARDRTAPTCSSEPTRKTAPTNQPFDKSTGKGTENRAWNAPGDIKLISSSPSLMTKRSRSYWTASPNSLAYVTRNSTGEGCTTIASTRRS